MYTTFAVRDITFYNCLLNIAATFRKRCELSGIKIYSSMLTPSLVSPPYGGQCENI